MYRVAAVAGFAAVLPFVPPFLRESVLPAVRAAGAIAPWEWNVLEVVRLAVRLAGLVFGVCSVGRAVLRLTRLHPGRGWERAGQALGAGFSVIAVILLGLGLAGLWRTGLLRGGWVLLMVAGMISVVHLIRIGLPTQVSSVLRGAAVEIVTAVVALPFLVAMLMAPHVGTTSIHDLGVARSLLESGRNFGGPGTGAWTGPADALTVLALTVGGESAVRGLEWLLGLALAMLAAGFAVRLTGRARLLSGFVLAALCAGTLQATEPGVRAISGAMFVLLSTNALLRAVGRGRAVQDGPALVAGLAAGLGLAESPAGSGLVVLLTGVVLLRSAPSALVVFLIGAAGTFLPFASPAINPHVMSGALVWIPTPPAAAGLEPAMIAGLVAACLGAAGTTSKARRTALLVLAAHAGAGIWMYGETGLAIVVGVMLCAVAAGMPRAVVVIALVVQVIRVPAALETAGGPWRVMRGQQTRSDYVTARQPNPPTAAADFLASHRLTGPGRRVLVVADARGWWFPAYAVWSGSGRHGGIAGWIADQGSRAGVQLRQSGVRWLLVNVAEALRRGRWEGEGGAPGASAEEWLKRFFEDETRLVFARGGAWVYEVAPNPDGAELPECWRGATGRNPATSFACAVASRAALAAGRRDDARRRAVAAVAAGDRSGLAWSAMGDVWLDLGRLDSAAGAYQQALLFGWRTSEVYRNQASAFHRLGRHDLARQALEYALAVDPGSPILLAEIAQVELAVRRGLGLELPTPP